LSASVRDTTRAVDDTSVPAIVDAAARYDSDRRSTRHTRRARTRGRYVKKRVLVENPNEVAASSTDPIHDS
jgi:hypothetical protein